MNFRQGCPKYKKIIYPFTCGFIKNVFKFYSLNYDSFIQVPNTRFFQFILYKFRAISQGIPRKFNRLVFITHSHHTIWR